MKAKEEPVLEPRYGLRVAQELCDDDETALMWASSSDGLNARQRGVLFIVLALIMLESDKCIREDVLYERMQELDKTLFSGTVVLVSPRRGAY